MALFGSASACDDTNTDDESGDSAEAGEAGEAGDSGDPGPYDNKSYTVSIDTNSWNRPTADVGSEVGAYVPTFLLSFGASSDGEVEVLLGLGSPGSTTQNLCNGTASFTLPSPDTPNEIGPLTVSTQITHTDEDDEANSMTANANIYDLTMVDVILSDEEDRPQGTFEATVDIREIAMLFSILVPDAAERNPDSVCTGLMTAGAECQPCDHTSGDGESYCLTLGAILVAAEEVDDLDLEPNPDPSCE